MKEYKGYKVELVAQLNLYALKNKQGPMPEALSGYYSTPRDVMQAVDACLANKKKGYTSGTTKEVSSG